MYLIDGSPAERAWKHFADRCTADEEVMRAYGRDSPAGALALIDWRFQFGVNKLVVAGLPCLRGCSHDDPSVKERLN